MSARMLRSMRQVVELTGPDPSLDQYRAAQRELRERGEDARHGARKADGFDRPAGDSRASRRALACRRSLAALTAATRPARGDPPLPAGRVRPHPRHRSLSAEPCRLPSRGNADPPQSRSCGTGCRRRSRQPRRRAITASSAAPQAPTLAPPTVCHPPRGTSDRLALFPASPGQPRPIPSNTFRPALHAADPHSHLPARGHPPAPHWAPCDGDLPRRPLAHRRTPLRRADPRDQLTGARADVGAQPRLPT
jgi:hypothetical protein